MKGDGFVRSKSRAKEREKKKNIENLCVYCVSRKNIEKLCWKLEHPYRKKNIIKEKRV